MLGTGRLAWIFAAILPLAAGACGSTPPRDQNYGTDLGADFHPPVVDAAADTAATGAGGAAGNTGGTAGDTGGSAGDAGGAAGDTGAGGAAGSSGGGT